ncbi:histone-lysine N-methyltransferase SETMAR [Trichonephila clavipes]|nr:histone-lysine N-methyltransferase SETMAR [Trichonephila clavipes]
MLRFSMIFKATLSQDDCDQRLQSAFVDDSPCRATVFRRFKEFCRGRNCLRVEEQTGRLQSTVIPDNMSAIRKMLMDYNRCTYQMIQKELNIRFEAIRKLINEELHKKKVVCRLVPHYVTEHQKEERERLSESAKKSLNCKMVVPTASFLKL